MGSTKKPNKVYIFKDIKKKTQKNKFEHVNRRGRFFSSLFPFFSDACSCPARLAQEFPHSKARRGCRPEVFHTMR